MGVKYVDDFEFPASAGFTGSGGQQAVRGYMRGGAVKVPKAGTPKVAVPKPGAKGNKPTAPIMRKAEGGLAVKRKGVPVASAKPIIERTPPKPMAVVKQGTEAGDTDMRVQRATPAKRVVPGRDNYAEGGKVVKKNLGGIIAPLIGGLLGSQLFGKKKKKNEQEGPPAPINAAQALAQRTGQDPSGLKRGGRVKC